MEHLPIRRYPDARLDLIGQTYREPDPGLVRGFWNSIRSASRRP